jgi:hypothetical protein
VVVGVVRKATLLEVIVVALVVAERVALLGTVVALGLLVKVLLADPVQALLVDMVRAAAAEHLA